MKTIKLASFPVGYPDPDYLLGPFTIPAMCELLFRAKAFTHEDASGGYTDDPDDPDELDLFERMHLVEKDPYTYFPYYAAGSSEEWGFEFSLFETGVGPWTGHNTDGECFIYDIAGDIYLRGRCALSDPELVSAGNWSNDAAGGPETITFRLAAGDFPVTVFGDFSAIFEITEWYPFKTTAGAAAWNTATGASANGGPGA